MGRVTIRTASITDAEVMADLWATAMGVRREALVPALVVVLADDERICHDERPLR